jgi:hypothetical protein
LHLVHDLFVLIRNPFIGTIIAPRTPKSIPLQPQV